MNDLVASDVRDATGEELQPFMGVTQVREHGEIGPILVRKDDHFLTERAARKRGNS